MVFDFWNGMGIIIVMVVSNKVCVIGFDINFVMVIVVCVRFFG